MDVSARLIQAQESFNRHQTEREQHLKAAEDNLTEMTKLQGEYRVLQDLLSVPEPNTDPTTIEAIPEEDITNKKEG